MPSIPGPECRECSKNREILAEDGGEHVEKSKSEEKDLAKAEAAVESMLLAE